MRPFAEHQFSERLLETAASWIVLIDERALTEDEREAFKRWVREADPHRMAFEHTAAVWGRMDILEGLSEMFPMASPQDSSSRRGPGAALRGLGAVAVAAALIAGIYLLATNDRVLDGTPPSAELYVTRIGETATIDLEDGSTIVANTNSSLSVEFSDTERRVTVDRGEAYFEVEHDADRVFRVIAGSTAIRAVGTAFSVFRDDASTEVLVSEGLVEVTHSAAGTGGEDPGNDKGKILVQVGQIAELGPSEARVESIEADEIARRLFWRQGMLAFDGEPLERVIETFSRYTTVELRIGSDDLRDVRVGGYFHAGDLAAMLTALQSNFGIEVTYLGPDRVMLTSSK